MDGCLKNSAKHWESVARSNLKRIDQLEEALKESVELQSHYAGLLNFHDGGERILFENVDEWMHQLRSLKEIKDDKRRI